jgi:hypothetical protein
VHAIIETPAYLAAAANAGLDEEERWAIVDAVAADPKMGDVIVGSGGCRKFRFARRGKGKSAGYRIITFFGGQNVPVFLITVFGKNEKANLSKAECNELKKLAGILIASLSVTDVIVRRG